MLHCASPSLQVKSSKRKSVHHHPSPRYNRTVHLPQTPIDITSNKRVLVLPRGDVAHLVLTRCWHWPLPVESERQQHAKLSCAEGGK